MNRLLQLQNLISEFGSVDNLKIIDTLPDLEKFSRDFFDYSPILESRLQSCCADLVVRPSSVEAVMAVAGACKRNGIPLTLRGSGTGNYGQCVPLEGGVVMLMSNLNNIRHIDSLSGEVTVEPGCLLRDLNRQLSKYARQLRLLPSTWRSASIGGFLAGGSGGIGSVRWGFLRDPGHLLGLEVVTVEDNPSKLQLNATEAEALNHAYGTNGIITSMKLATAPLVPWQEISIDCEKFSDAINLLQQITRSALDLFLCSLLENKIVENLPPWSGKATGSHRLLILVSPDGLTTLKRLATSSGGIFKHLGPEKESAGSGLRELTWNHTTLHMRSVDSDWTYLQMLLPQPEIDLISSLKTQWGNDVLWHLEGVRQQGAQRIAALPLVRWRGKHFLEKLITECKAKGAIIFNPHVITVEDGGLGVVDVDQVEAKRRYDPQGILNPGKLKGWSV
tara:strand:+ start:5303 stop:6646 length:1344 start_codon:yes stop_codon:yes gene_type:complete